MTIRTVATIAELPNVPSVYALYGGRDRNRYVAYVGIANKLKQRIEQHLVRKDSSIATGTSTVHLNPDYVTGIDWWEHVDFSERHVLEAAETVCFRVLEPALRSRGRTQHKALELLNNNNFVTRMQSLFESAPTGRLHIPTLAEALERIKELERRIELLEQKSQI